MKHFASIFSCSCLILVTLYALLASIHNSLKPQNRSLHIDSLMDSLERPSLTLALVSDTHGFHSSGKLNIPFGDVLIFAGDAGETWTRIYFAIVSHDHDLTFDFS